MNWRGIMQRVARALMVPIVVLPVAALLIAIGEFGPDFFAAAGNAIIQDYLPLLFAVGVAIGFTNSDGMAAFAAVVGHQILVAVMTNINPGVEIAGRLIPNEMNVLGGIMVGAVTAALYHRFHKIRFPEFLGLFSGKRFVPIITAVACLGLGAVFGYLWPPINHLILNLGDWIFDTGGVGIFLYGVLNRLLIPTGLHHILQNLILLVFGSWVTPDGVVVTGELTRFYAGDPTAGFFSGGFFITMLFALPAAALAMVHEAKIDNRKAVAGVMLTAALTSIVTGITEPVEFTFIFVAPVLFLVHSLLTGTALLLSFLLGIRHYGYALPMFFINISHSANPWLIFPLGLVFGVAYYFIFRGVIRLFNYPTPGREQQQQHSRELSSEDLKPLARQVVSALGGVTNLVHVDACITRLRVTVLDGDRLDKGVLDKLPASGISFLDSSNLQIVLGSRSEELKDVILELVEEAEIVMLKSPFDGEVLQLADFPDPVFSQGMLGFGVGFMPTGNTVVAPCDGEIVKVFPGGHALLVKESSGLELLVHIGLDTVDLEGKGFEVFCGDGSQVQAGQLLVKFDRDTITAAGKTMHSALVVTNKEAVSSYSAVTVGKVAKGRSGVMAIESHKE